MVWHLDLHLEKFELKGMSICLAHFSPLAYIHISQNSFRKAVVARALNCIQKNKCMKSCVCNFSGVVCGFACLVLLFWFWSLVGCFCGCVVTF